MIASGLYPAYQAQEYSTVQAADELMKSQLSSLFHQARHPWKMLPVSPTRVGVTAEAVGTLPVPVGGQRVLVFMGVAVEEGVVPALLDEETQGPCCGAR